MMNRLTKLAGCHLVVWMQAVVVLALGCGAVTSAAQGSQAAAPPSNITMPGGGDGYRPILFNGKVYAINHHSTGDALVCADQITGAACPGYPTSVPPTAGSPFAAVGTAGVGSNWYQTTTFVDEYLNRATGKLYFYALEANVAPYKLVVVCADLMSQTSCGSYNFNAGSVDGSLHSSGGSFGARYYATTNVGTIACFDTTAFVPCAGTASDGTFAVPGAVPPNGDLMWSTVQIGSQLFWPQLDGFGTTAIVCFDMATNGPCAGFSSPSALPAYMTNNPLPGATAITANSAGVPNGFCLVSVGVGFSLPTCFDLSGADVSSTPAASAFATYFVANPIAGGYLARALTTDGRTYWQSDLTGTTQKFCWDWRTNAPCAGYDQTTTGLSPSFYTAAIDPANPSCIWSLGDAGIFGASDATDGGLCKARSTNIGAAVPVPTLDAAMLIVLMGGLLLVSSFVLRRRVD